MEKVEAIKFGSSVNAANAEHMFLHDTSKSKLDVFYDEEKSRFFLIEKSSGKKTIVFSTNVQWARFAGEDDAQPSTESVPRRGRPPGIKRAE